MYRRVALARKPIGNTSISMDRWQPAAPDRGNEADRSVCRPDVVKFCQAELSKNQDEDDAFAILACLQGNRVRISPRYGQLLANNGQWAGSADRLLAEYSYRKMRIDDATRAARLIRIRRRNCGDLLDIVLQPRRAARRVLREPYPR